MKQLELFPTSKTAQQPIAVFKSAPSFMRPGDIIRIPLTTIGTKHK